MVQPLWLLWSRETFNKKNPTIMFTGSISTEEFGTTILDLAGKKVTLLIRSDFPPNTIYFQREIPIQPDQQSFLFMFTPNLLPPIAGEYKIEIVALDEDDNLIGITHHDDLIVED